MAETFKAFIDQPADAEVESTSLEPERRLARAVLQQVYRDLRSACRRRYAGRPYGQRDWDEIWNWFFKPDEDRTYPFEFACESLGRDPDRAREYFAKVVEQRIAGAPRRGKVLRKLTFGQFYEIKAALEQDDFSLEVGKAFGVDDSTIRKIRQQRLWKTTPSLSELPLAVEALNERLRKHRRPTNPVVRAKRAISRYFRGGADNQLEVAFAELAIAVQRGREAARATQTEAA